LSFFFFLPWGRPLGAFPEQKAGGTDEINKKTEGKYLVAHVCHKLTADNTVTSLGLVRDSYGKE